MEEITITVDGKQYDVKVEETAEGKVLVHCSGDVYEVDQPEDKEAQIFDILKQHHEDEGGEGVIKAPLPGTIFDILVKEDDTVKEGDILIKLVAMKMENDVVSPSAGKVKEIRVKKNEAVNKGTVLVVLE